MGHIQVNRGNTYINADEKKEKKPTRDNGNRKKTPTVGLKQAKREQEEYNEEERQRPK